MAYYRLGRCYVMLEDDGNALKNLKTLLYCVPPEEAERHPLETYWIVKGVNLLEQIAHKTPLPEQCEAAVQALKWLEKSGIQDYESVQKRILAVHKLQKRP